MNDLGYLWSKALYKELSLEKINELLSDKRILDLGWWVFQYGVFELSEDELNSLGKNLEDGEGDWLTVPRGIKRAHLLSDYASAFYQATGGLLEKTLEEDHLGGTEALPVLFIFHQFVELSLKASVEYMVFFRDFQGRLIKKPKLVGHSLTKILQDLANLFEPEEPFLSEETQQFIRKIDRFNELAQAVRYPFDSKDAKIFFSKRRLFPIAVFKAEFDIHGREVNDFCTWLGLGYIYADEDGHIHQGSEK